MIQLEIGRALWFALGLWVVVSLAGIDFLKPARREAGVTRVSGQVTRSAWFGLAVWLTVSLAALATIRLGPLPALVLGGAGGVAFGWVSARRVDPRRMKVRTRRQRRRRSGSAAVEREQGGG